MATIVLQNAGASLGGALFGPLGAILGRAIGGAAGYAIDQKLFGQERVESGARLEHARIMSSSDGAPMPRVYGRSRIGGQIIWATRFEEVTSRSKSGGKGSPGVTVEEYAYFANFAVGICEGEISTISRIWADGNEIDQTKYEIRIYTGSDQQLPDMLIEAKQGNGNAPAYRGTAYAVFEGFPLEQFGNRIPQLSFEVIRSVSKLDQQIRAITVIPGSTEFGYSPRPIVNPVAPGADKTVNRNNSIKETDWSASMDELVSLCPNLETVALVVSWFGDDLRAGNCRVEPRVEHNSGGGKDWRVSGIDRTLATEVSRIDDRPAFGGTPSDSSVLAAIADLKSRGLKVVLYPFLMMDVPSGNGLSDPYGGSEQAAYPWRGRISCDPAPGQSGTSDRTAIARNQIADFAGTVASSDFLISGSNLSYLGPDEWTYKRLILHYASLAKAAGGVDGFLIGSEMVGLTTVRDETGAFPFVDELGSLASQVRTIVGNSTMISYGADWSEYFGYHPSDGSNDLLFHLDPLWANPEIDAVAIDNYMPLSDWRIGGDPEATEIQSQVDPDYLQANIEGGEGFDWFYASEADRVAGIRTPITDGMGEPWVWRYKDIRSWWGQPHHERINGIRSPQSTQWIPQSKPVIFTEIGCGAVTMGANQPNVFADPKSAEGAIPRFSTGARSDIVQSRFLSAHYEYWSDDANNPVSAIYGGKMIDVDWIFPWAWDARPFPFFPADGVSWSDGLNWHTGHWLNGRLGGCPVAELVEAIASDYGELIKASCDGFVDGYIVRGPVSARDALEPIASMFGLQYSEDQGEARIFDRNYVDVVTLDASDLVRRNDEPLAIRSREHDNELPAELALNHAGIFSSYEAEDSYSRRLEGESSRSLHLNVPVVLPGSSAIGALEAGLRDIWHGREKLEIGLPDRYLGLSPGDFISLGSSSTREIWRIDSIEDGDFRRLQMRAASQFETLPIPTFQDQLQSGSNLYFGKPQLIAMNLPIHPEASTPRFHIALSADPWARSYAIWSSPTLSDFTLRKTAIYQVPISTLVQPLASGPEGRWDMSNEIHVQSAIGTLESKTISQVLNGANAAAILAANGEWEILQFADAQLQSDGSWILSRLLRAQHGSDSAMLAGAAVGSKFVLLDTGLETIELTELEEGLELNWRAGPSQDSVSAESYSQVTHLHQSVSKRPLSPVHLSAGMLENGDMVLSWLRRSRVSADSWEAAEIPLGETMERYLIEIFDTGGEVIRSIDVQEMQYVYTASEQVQDHGQQISVVDFSSAQIASSGIPGTARRAVLQL